MIVGWSDLTSPFRVLFNSLGLFSLKHQGEEAADDFFCLHGRSRGASVSRPRCCAAVLFLDQMRSNGLANKTRLGFRAFINRLQVKLPGTARGQKSKHTFFTVNFLTYVGYFFGLSKLLSFCKRYLLVDFI